MLNVNLSNDAPLEVKNLFTQWRREHVSSYAVNVVQKNESHIDIIDSRFESYPTKHHKVLGFLSWVLDPIENRREYTLHSRLIANKKFGRHNESHSSRTTHDLRKMAKWIRSYLHPFTLDEIARRTFSRIEAEVENWTNQPNQELERMFWSVDRSVFGREIIRLALLGVEIGPKDFTTIIKRGPPLVAEYEDRLSSTGIFKHVLINQDGTVVVSVKMDKQEDKVIELEEDKVFKLEAVYQSFSLCPVNIQQQVALLRLHDKEPDKDHTFLPRVGSKISDSEFWVIEQN